MKLGVTVIGVRTIFSTYILNRQKKRLHRSLLLNADLQAAACDQRTGFSLILLAHVGKVMMRCHLVLCNHLINYIENASMCSLSLVLNYANGSLGYFVNAMLILLRVLYIVLHSGRFFILSINFGVLNIKWHFVNGHSGTSTLMTFYMNIFGLRTHTQLFLNPILPII